MKLALFAMAALRTTFPTLVFGSAAQFRADVNGLGSGSWGLRFYDDGTIDSVGSSGSAQNVSNPPTFLNPTSPFIAYFCEVRLVVTVYTATLAPQVSFDFAGTPVNGVGTTAWKQIPRGGLSFLIQASTPGESSLLTEFEVQIRNRFTLQTITRAARYTVAASTP